MKRILFQINQAILTIVIIRTLQQNLRTSPMKSSNQNNKDKDAISNKSSNVVMIRSLEYKEYRRMSPMKNRNQNNKDKDTN